MALEPQQLMEQSAGTARFYLGAALKACEDMEITAAPEIVAAFMHACTVDFDTMMRHQAWEDQEVAKQQRHDEIHGSK